MRFRVTSVTDEACAEELRSLGNRIEDWLTNSLGDADFGIGVDQLSLVIVCVDEDAVENERWSKPHRRLGRYTDQSGTPVRFLSVSVPIPPTAVSSGHPLAAVTGSAIDALRTRPHRLPKGFDFGPLSSSTTAALAALIET